MRPTLFWCRPRRAKRGRAVWSAAGLSVALALVHATACSSGSSGDDHARSDAGGGSTEDASFEDAIAPAPDDAGRSCVNESPKSCPDAAPSYASDVLPILETHCYECHSDAGIDQSQS